MMCYGCGMRMQIPWYRLRHCRRGRNRYRGEQSLLSLTRLQRQFPDLPVERDGGYCDYLAGFRGLQANRLCEGR